MPVMVSLAKNDRVIIHNYCDPLKLSEIEASFDKYRTIYAAAAAPIHSIFDASRLIYFPKSIIDALHFISKQPDNLFNHPMNGASVIVTMSSYVMMMASLATGMIPDNHISVVKSTDEAWAKIEELWAAERIAAINRNPIFRH